VTVWILAGGLAAAAIVIVVLWLGVRRARTRAAAIDELIATARARLRAVVEEQTAEHADEVRRLLARERAESISVLAAEERRLADERRGEHEARERGVAETLAERFAEAERRVDERLRAFTDDLDRAQRHLEAQLARLEQRHRQAIVDVEHRIEAEAAELGSTADEQRKTALRLREDLERAATEAVTEALDELESQATERRRAIDEITDRLRVRESAIAEGIERAETDARGRLEVMFVEFERRQTERVERVLSRELDRHVQAAALAFDERMRELREDAASRLARELDRAVELLGRDELARRVESRVESESAGSGSARTRS
jgi:hypothetical protein